MGVRKSSGEVALRRLSATDANNWPITNQLKHAESCLLAANRLLMWVNMPISRSDGYLQCVCVNEKASQLRRRYFRQIQWESALQHANAKPRKQLSYKPVVPFCGERFRKYTLDNHWASAGQVETQTEGWAGKDSHLPQPM